jgi:hypothetical protein
VSELQRRILNKVVKIWAFEKKTYQDKSISKDKLDTASEGHDKDQ